MVRNVRGTELDTAIRPIIASGNDYPHDYEIAPHHHARGQLLHGVPGVMTVRTEHGAWVVPPDQAVWIPPHIEHSVRMMGEVETSCVFVDPNHVAGLPEKCQVLSVSPLMRCLIQAAVDLPLDYALTGREGEIMALLLSELRALPVLPLSLPFPADPRLGERCQAFLARPLAHQTIDEWADSLGMSRRTFTRHFKRECGLSFAAWQRQACLFAALPRLAEGEAVTTIALDLGYDSPAAFTTMFRKTLGFPPSRYLTAAAA
ncbi:helix-turn-helix domain-containing protein [Dongia mobilis]|uniref:AraC family transcriptional regulator n=1 Tax=Dongia sp. TaxID=1977262 RepID=UPI0026F0F0A8